jgi:nucleoside diphosphate kinase
MEQTLVVFKPDAVMRGIVGEILTRFERAGFKVIGMKMVRPGYDQLHGHYEGIGTLKTRKGEEIFESQLAAMQVGPVIAMVLEGVEAVEFVTENGRGHAAQDRYARHYTRRLCACDLWPGRLCWYGGCEPCACFCDDRRGRARNCTLVL